MLENRNSIKFRTKVLDRKTILIKLDFCLAGKRYFLCKQEANILKNWWLSSHSDIFTQFLFGDQEKHIEFHNTISVHFANFMFQRRYQIASSCNTGQEYWIQVQRITDKKKRKEAKKDWNGKWKFVAFKSLPFLNYFFLPSLISQLLAYKRHHSPNILSSRSESFHHDFNFFSIEFHSSLDFFLHFHSLLLCRKNFSQPFFCSPHHSSSSSEMEKFVLCWFFLLSI